MLLPFSSAPFKPPSQTGNAGKFLTTDGSKLSWATVSASPGGSDTFVQFNDGGLFNGVSGWTFDKTNIVQTLTHNGLGTTSSDGIVLKNTTAAANNAQQISPRLHFQGQGWKSGVTAASRSVDWIAELTPVQGLNNPQARLDLKYQINGGGYQTGVSFINDPTFGVLMGVGISPPISNLHISGLISPSFRIQSLTGNQAEARFTVNDSLGVVTMASNIQAGAPYDFGISFGGTPVARFTYQGFVGLGDNFVPTKPLQVAAAGTGGTVFFEVDSGGAGIPNGGLAVGNTSSSNNPDTILGIYSTTQGFLPPVMTQTQRDAIGAATPGLFIHNSDTEQPNYFDGVVWQALSGKSLTVLHDDYVDAGNVSTGETDLFTYTILATQWTLTAQKIMAEYGGIFVSSATATRELRAYFAGTLIFDSGAISISVGNDSWYLKVFIIASDLSSLSSAVFRVIVSASTSGASTSAYTQYTDVTFDLSRNDTILKITGQAAGVGASSDDIVAKQAVIEFLQAA